MYGFYQAQGRKKQLKLDAREEHEYGFCLKDATKLEIFVV